MIFVYILVILILLLFFTPSRVKIKYNVNTNFDKNEENEELDTNNCISLYIFYFIKIKDFKMNNEEKVSLEENYENKKLKKKSSFKLIFDTITKFLLELLNMKKVDEALITKEEIKKISKHLYFEKINLNLGVNLKDVIVNVYIISILNAVINMYFAKNADRINFKKTEYVTYISNKILNIKIESIIRFSFANTMIIILKILLRYRKVVKKNGKRASNRKFNDDSYDFA